MVAWWHTSPAACQALKGITLDMHQGTIMGLLGWRLISWQKYDAWIQRKWMSLCEFDVEQQLYIGIPISCQESNPKKYCQTLIFFMSFFSNLPHPLAVAWLGLKVTMAQEKARQCQSSQAPRVFAVDNKFVKTYNSYSHWFFMLLIRCYDDLWCLSLKSRQLCLDDPWCHKTMPIPASLFFSCHLHVKWFCIPSIVRCHAMSESCIKIE